MSDEVTIIGWHNDPDTMRLRAAFDLNGIRYTYHGDASRDHPDQQVLTLARIEGVCIDFFGWHESAIRYIVEQFEHPTIIEHQE